ncbi:30S ribosomal protein S3 [Candidatus Vidania fulgoroideorum]
MGNKINPICFRSKIFQKNYSKWYSSYNYSDFFLIEQNLRNSISKEINNLYISNIYIEISKHFAIITIFSSKPGLIIGKSGEKIISLKKKLKSENKISIYISVKEIINPDIDPTLISKGICFSLEKRLHYKRIINRYLNFASKKFIRGIKIIISGRLNGNDIARKETFKYGKLALGTLSEKINYASSIAKTKYGLIGVKVWLNY